VQASEELVGELEGIDGGVLGGVAVEKKEDAEESTEKREGDDVKLLRIRTRRRELVVVPGEYHGNGNGREGVLIRCRSKVHSGGLS
jgi:hypothetical protein